MAVFTVSAYRRGQRYKEEAENVLMMDQDWFLYGVIIPVQPFALVSQSHVAPKDTQRWTSVLLAMCGGATCLFSPLCGYIADNTSSRRFPLLLGLIFLTTATALLCIGSSLTILASGRLLQGLSAAVLYTAGSALIAETVEQQNIGQAMGWLGWAQTASTIVSPVLGGVVFDRAGYRAVFAMVFALAAVDSVLRFGMIEKRIARQWQERVQNHHAREPSLDLQRGVEKEPYDGETSASTAMPTESRKSAISSLHHWLLGIGSWKPPKPAIFDLLREPDLLIALGGILIQTLFLTSFDTVLPLFAQATFHWGSTAAGLSFIPLLIPTLCAPVVGHVSDKYGARWPVATGFLLAAPGFICLRFVAHNTMAQKGLLCVLLAVAGLAFTLILVPLSGEVALAVDDRGGSRVYGQAYGLFNFMFGAGLVAGPLLSAYLRDRYGWGTLVLILGCMSVTSAIASATWIGRNRRRKSREVTEVSMTGGRIA
ncbi:MAG: hypothetical protein Q9216_002263 [Gyalolechia sp. 2 TL-2023]